MKTTFFSLAAIAATVLAKTDLEGCTSSQTIAFGGASMIYWDPTNGEICSFLDCGGGRAPPKTTVPGCDGYVGSATYSPDYMPGWGSATSTASSAASSAAEESETEAVSRVEASSSAESVPAYETKTGSAESTLVTSKAVLPSGVASGTAVGTGVITKGSNGTMTTGSPKPAEASGAAAQFGPGLVAAVAGVFGLAML